MPFRLSFLSVLTVVLIFILFIYISHFFGFLFHKLMCENKNVYALNAQLCLWWSVVLLAIISNLLKQRNTCIFCISIFLYYVCFVRFSNILALSNTDETLIVEIRSWCRHLVPFNFVWWCSAKFEHSASFITLL